MKEYCFGVDLGGTTVKIGLFCVDGTLVDSYKIPTRRENNGMYILSDISAALLGSLERFGICADDVQGIGIGVPGPVLQNGIVNGCVNLGWGRVDVQQELYKLTKIPVKAANDANVAALGEYWKGNAGSCDSMVMLTLGTGVGGGIILSGKPVCGANGAGGEFGHMPVIYDETECCSCGKRGCLEQAASATGIVRTARKILAASEEPSALREIENLTTKDIFTQAKLGDAIALQSVERLGFYLATAMAHIAAVIDPEVFVIGGGVSGAGDYLLDVITRFYREKAFHSSINARILLASLGNEAGMYGAAKLIIG